MFECYNIVSDGDLRDVPDARLQPPAAVRKFVRIKIAERAAMQMTRHKTESVYRRYAIAGA
jgi:hypothetical protein